MINEDKVKIMTKLAAFDKRQADECEGVTVFFRSDYIGREMLKSVVMGTLAFVILEAIWVLINSDELLENINRLDYMAMGADMLQNYLGFILMYLIVTYIVYAVRYSLRKKELKEYHKGLHSLLKIYEKEDNKNDNDFGN